MSETLPSEGGRFVREADGTLRPADPPPADSKPAKPQSDKSKAKE
ncbi:MAG: hypothetical protein AB7U62_10010 [Pseudolabrys sp.]